MNRYFLFGLILVVIVTAMCVDGQHSPKPAKKSAKRVTPRPAAKHSAVKTTKRTTKAPPRYDCHTCNSTGTDCKFSSRVEHGCDFCVKITGTMGSPDDIPDFFDNFVPGLSAAAAKYQGKVVTFRDCATQPLIAAATGGEQYGPNDVGCQEYPELMGVKKVKACLCKGDCH